MKIFLLWFLSAWVAGCVLGVAGIGFRWLIVYVLITGLTIWLLKRSWHEGFVVIALLLLGFVYGDMGARVKAGECDLGFSEYGAVVLRPDLKVNQTSFVMNVRECTVLVSVSPFVDVQRRDEVQVSGGSVQELDEIRDYSEGYADYLERRGIGYVWRYPDVQVSRANTSDGHWIDSQVQKLHIVLRNRVQRLFVEPDASIVSAMLLAEKGMIPEDVTQQFRATGVSHILAISGLHVAIIAGLILLIASWLPLKPWWKTGLVAGLLWVYVFIIGYPISAIRAASFISLALLFFRFSKLTSLPTALVLTVSVLVTIRPEVVLDVGFQLSVSAVIGIFLILFVGGKVPFQSKRMRVLIWFYRLFLVSLGATLFTWPLLAYHFGTISVIGLLANLVVVPIVPLIIWIAIIAMVCSLVWMPVAMMLGLATHWLFKWLLFITLRLSELPGVYYENVEISQWVIVIYYLCLGLVTVVIVSRQKRSWREIWE